MFECRFSSLLVMGCLVGCAPVVRAPDAGGTREGSEAPVTVVELPVARKLHGDVVHMTALTAPASDLFAVVGASRDEVWIAGAHGTLLHFDGATTSPVPSGLGSTFVH
jgi:hypothetical protein